MNKLNVLILDDELRIREELSDFLTDNGYIVFSAPTPSEAFAIIAKNPIDLAIIDINLPEMDGITALREIKVISSDIEVLIITGQGDMQTVINAMRLGAADFFNKPIRLPEVLIAIERTTRFIKLNRQFQHIRQSYEQLSNELNEHLGVQIIGSSKAIKATLQDIKIAAENADTPVLITGESGTGKELVARSIHFLSSRRNSYFYAVNCAAIPDNLFESEFFGYVKGAFTGAISAKPGWFETADKGTLFLDEIGDMNGLMQAKLLRISEDGKVRRIGANRDCKVDVRIITATNRNIEKLVNEGAFRQDLLHRLNTFHIKLAPLRERAADIPILVNYYLDLFARKTGKNITGIEASLLEKLCTYSFPGNIRELKNMLERAVMLCHNNHISHKHFASELFCSDDNPRKQASAAEEFDLALIEKQTIQKALQKTQYNKLQAAKLLNLSWQALERRIEKHGL